MILMRRLIIIGIVLFFFINYAYASGEKVFVLEVEGVIDPITMDYIARGIDKAVEEDAEALIIQMDTPGGLDTAMRGIIMKVLDSDVPVVIYVYPSGARAASAGSFILIASHVAAMAPGTNVGAAHPVAIGGEEGAVGEKIVQDAAAYMRSLAELKDRNISLAESFVFNATSISSSEALENNIIEIVAEDYPSLLDLLDGRVVEIKGEERTLVTKGAELITMPMSAREEFLHIISNPNIAYILFIAGMYGIIFELSNPGAILPGVIGGICIILAFWSFQALSISATGLALIIFAMILFIAELKSPTHGILTAGGVISLFLGSIMLIEAEKEPFVEISLKVIVPATALTALFFIFAVGLAIKAHKRRPATGIEGMIGAIGTAREDLDPEGRVFIKGERWRARAREGKIQKDKKIKVVDVNNSILIVEEER